MRKNQIKAKIAAGGKIVNGWCAIPHSYATEVFAHCGWDSVTVDMQHGPVDFDQAVQMMQAISTTDATPLCRVPWNDPAMIMKLLDAGSFGLVCPMINSKEEAEQFVANARYAREIAIRWNIKDSGVGYVTRFRVPRATMERYPLQKVGGAHHTEWWVPAEELEALNDAIVGRIEVIGEYRDANETHDP